MLTRALSRIALFGAAIAVLATCSIDAVRFTPAGDPPGDAPPDTPPAEDCEVMGDEDGNGAADCDDPACAAVPACIPATCTDQQRNGDETDVDCGGSCPVCADGARCAADGDCDSGLCGGQACLRAESCSAILAAGVSHGDGLYSIDPDGAGGAPAFQVKCDMTIDGGGWTRFNWVTGAYPVNADPFGQLLSECAAAAAVCRGRIPVTANPVHFMIKDLGDGDVALWQFNATNEISNAALAAFRNKTTVCLANRTPWQPYLYSGTEDFCGTGMAGSGCDSFVYVDTSVAGCQAYTGWYTQLDDDTGCHRTAFKMGMTHTGYETLGCASPDVNYLDDGPTTDDDNTGELYYR